MLVQFRGVVIFTDEDAFGKLFNYSTVNQMFNSVIKLARRKKRTRIEAKMSDTDLWKWLKVPEPSYKISIELSANGDTELYQIYYGGINGIVVKIVENRYYLVVKLGYLTTLGEQRIKSLARGYFSQIIKNWKMQITNEEFNKLVNNFVDLFFEFCSPSTSGECNLIIEFKPRKEKEFVIDNFHLDNFKPLYSIPDLEKWVKEWIYIDNFSYINIAGALGEVSWKFCKMFDGALKESFNELARGFVELFDSK